MHQHGRNQDVGMGVVRTKCSEAWTESGCARGRDDAIKKGCNQDVGKIDMVMGSNSAWTSSWSSRMLWASDVLEYEISRCGHGCSVGLNP